jgi:hypothetical protein
MFLSSPLWFELQWIIVWFLHIFRYLWLLDFIIVDPLCGLQPLALAKLLWRKPTFVIIKVFAHSSQACLSSIIDVFIWSPRAFLNKTFTIFAHPLHNLPCASLLHRRGHHAGIRITGPPETC